MPDNPPISPLLRFMTAIEVLVLAITGFGLFFFSAQLATLWPWTLTPFNAGSLGAVYLSSLLAAGILVKDGHWFPARIVTAMVFAFTSIVFLVSLLYWGSFDQSKSFSVWGWFLLYAILPINAAYHLWFYRRISNPNPLILPAWLKKLLLVEALAYGLYGLAMLLFPVESTAFWPWTIDAFHGRIYSVVFITPAVGTFILYQDANLHEMKVLGLTHILGGLLPVLALVMVEFSVHRLNWSAVGTWLWIGICLFIFLMGLLLMRQSK